MSKHILRFSEFWSRFSRDKTAVLGLAIILAVIIMGVSAPIIAPYDLYAMTYGLIAPPSWEHPLGTDTLARDVLTRIIWGSRQTLYIGFGAAALAALIGVAIGAVSGYAGGVIGSSLMKLTDFTMVIPSFFLCILIFAEIRNYDPAIMFSVIAFLMWPTMARIVRADFLSLKERDFVKAAKALGASDVRIIFRELLPNCFGSVIVVLTMNISYAILFSSALQYIGVGDPVSIEWGTMLNQGRQTVQTGWWLSVFPGLMIFLVALSFNLVGDGLRDALDPRLRGV